MSERITNIKRTITIEGEQENRPPSFLEGGRQVSWSLPMLTGVLFLVVLLLGLLAAFH